MHRNLFRWLKIAYKNIVTSIAFLPAVIALMFLLLSFAMIAFDFSPAGKSIKSNLHWLSLKDANTARSICSVIAGGIISLAVFSFSMVMILLNQAASQMSNRILGKLISNRFQQVVLGFYVGTIVYALFLLSTIRDINSGIYVPAISTYLLIALTVADIFLFIYFLHYITNSIKYETIINKIYDTTKNVMLNACTLKQGPVEYTNTTTLSIAAHKSGLYQGFEKNSLISLCKKHDATVSFLLPVGTYILEGTDLLNVSVQGDISKEFIDHIQGTVNIHRGQEIETSFYYGFNQLMEIAIKALSPGINDPGTAVLSLHALGDLLALKLNFFEEVYLTDDEDTLRVIVKEKTFEEIFSESVLPVWDYGCKDRLVQREMANILAQLKIKSNKSIIEKLSLSVQSEVIKVK